MRLLLLVLFLTSFPGIARASPTTTSTETIDLNTAPAGILVGLPGIGEKRAREIVALRRVRPFKRLEDLRRLKGFGPKTLAKLRPRIHIAPTPQKKTSSSKSRPPSNRRKAPTAVLGSNER